MKTGHNNPPPLSFPESISAGAFLTIASVGWIAALVVVATWISSGFAVALFWSGLIMGSGALLFYLLVVVSLICKGLNVSNKQKRRNLLKAFVWASLFSTILAATSLWISSSLIPNTG